MLDYPAVLALDRRQFQPHLDAQSLLARLMKSDLGAGPQEAPGVA
jgi:hypothetical protein